MRAVLSQVIGLTRLCIAGPGGKIGALYFLLIFGLGLAGVQVTVRLISWTRISTTHCRSSMSMARSGRSRSSSG